MRKWAEPTLYTDRRSILISRAASGEWRHLARGWGVLDVCPGCHTLSELPSRSGSADSPRVGAPPLWPTGGGVGGDEQCHRRSDDGVASAGDVTGRTCDRACGNTTDAGETCASVCTRSARAALVTWRTNGHYGLSEIGTRTRTPRRFAALSRRMGWRRAVKVRSFRLTSAQRLDRDIADAHEVRPPTHLLHR